MDIVPARHKCTSRSIVPSSARVPNLERAIQRHKILQGSYHSFEMSSDANVLVGFVEATMSYGAKIHLLTRTAGDITKNEFDSQDLDLKCLDGMMLHPGGKHMIVTGYGDKGSKLIRLSDWNKIRDINCEPLYFSRDGKTMVSYIGDSLRVSNFNTGKTLCEIDGRLDPFSASALGRTGRYLFAGGEEGTVYRFELETGKCINEIATNELDSNNLPKIVKSIFPSADDNHVTVVNDSHYGNGYNYSMTRLDLLKEKIVYQKEISHPDKKPDDHITELVESGDGRCLIFGNYLGAVFFADQETGNFLPNVIGGNNGKNARSIFEGKYISKLCPSPDGKYVYCGNADGSIMAVEIETGLIRFGLECGDAKGSLFRDSVSFLGTDKEGKTLVACQGDSLLHIDLKGVLG